VETASQSSVYSDGDVDTNHTANTHLWDLAEALYSRRQAMSGLGAASAAFLGSSLLAGCSGDGNQASKSPTGAVSAGEDITTTAGRVVTLTGSRVGDTTGIGAFEQVSGPPVTLTNAGTSAPSFIAPAVNTPTQLVFRITGTGSAGQPISDEVTVTINPAELGFAAVAKNRDDVVTIPAGYSVTILYRTGDPILPGVAAYKNDGTDTNFAGRAGDHHDGLYYYGLNSGGTGRNDANSERGLLVMNHENINEQYLHVGPATNVSAGPRPAGEALKEIEAHGVSVVECSARPAAVLGL
jgi:hypothetical protein